MWPRRKADEYLEEIIRENGLAKERDTPSPQPQRFSLFANRRKTAPFTARPSAQSRDRRSDLTIAALGVTLGLICALFPWYIFFNPDEFGVRAMKFGGNGPGAEPIMLGAQPDRVGAPVASQDIPPLELDLRTTGTATQEPEDADGTPGQTEQPFPAPISSFRLIQIANGRAMIEDDTGLFIVEPGSVLPDGARVRSIEQRDGHPVLVTESGTMLEISE